MLYLQPSIFTSSAADSLLPDLRLTMHDDLLQTSVSLALLLLLPSFRVLLVPLDVH
jgi:hypothetical protein